jgi:hypothetical protein
MKSTGKGLYSIGARFCATCAAIRCMWCNPDQRMFTTWAHRHGTWRMRNWQARAWG